MFDKIGKIEKILIYVIVVILVFTSGVFVGKRSKAAELPNEEQIELSEGDVEVVEVEETQIDVETQIDEKTMSENEITSSDDKTENSQVPSISENLVTDDSIAPLPGHDVVPVWNQTYQDTIEKKTIQERMAIRSSYDETLLFNQQDKQIIADSKLDFSKMIFACLGDSITVGMGNSTPYPTVLRDLLGAKKVYNVGSGGSTIATGDGVDAMANRCVEIPPDVDVIIVMGGTNDNFYQASWQFGFMDWETKGEGTFCGDLELLMKKLQYTYPNARIIFLTPPSNSKIDEMKASNPALLDQGKYAEAIRYIGAEQGLPVVDLYNMNFLNSHDSNILTNFMGDSVHPNTAGNQVLAEKVASEIIKRYSPAN